MQSRRSWVRVSVSLLAALGPLVASVAAHAETCGDQVCPQNWECKSEMVTSDIACAPNTNCTPPEPQPYFYCSPLPCASDADCASDMVCYSETRTNCAELPTCPKDADCVAPADGGCTEETMSACVPRYVPPCDTDSDCGVGFTCEAQEECTCGGSAGTGSAGPGTPSSSGSAGSGSSGAAPAPAPPADGGAADPIPDPAPDGGAEPPPDAKVPSDGGTDVAPPTCTCTPTDVKTCKLTVVACSTASDCPAGFTCEDNPSGSCWASSDGSTGCDTPDPAKICAPPYTDLLNGGGRGVDAGGEVGVGTPLPSTDPSAPTGTGGATGSGGATTGSTEPPKGSSGSGSSATPDDPNAHEAAASNDDGEDVVTHAGCTVAGAPRESALGYGLVALGLAGLFGARRRRR